MVWLTVNCEEVEVKLSDSVYTRVIMPTSCFFFCHQAHNANQLAKWCLHFISTNYSVFKGEDEFEYIQGENRAHVEQHQWPPKSYYEELELYKEKIEKFHGVSSVGAGKCSVM